MSKPDAIPVFTLFGETGHFPDVVHCERFSARAPVHGWRISPHRHAQMAQVFLVQSGQIRVTLDGAGYLLEDGDFLFVPNNMAHGLRFLPDTRGLVISLPLNIVKTLGPPTRDLADTLGAPIKGRAGDVLPVLAGLLEATMADQAPFRAQRAVALAHSVLGILAACGARHAPARNGPRDPRLTRLDALIAAHMAKGWGASEYAKALSISPGHLSRLCRAATGRGAAAYVEQAVMEEACRLLAFTQLPVSEVGYRLGFSDPSYFSKRFRRARQVAPGAYRARFVD